MQKVMGHKGKHGWKHAGARLSASMGTGRQKKVPARSAERSPRHTAAELSGQVRGGRMLTRSVPPLQPSSQNSPQILAQPEMQVLGSPMAEKELGVRG